MNRRLVELFWEWLEPLTLLVIVAAIVYQLFLEPIVGVADNRDYYRVMRQIGVHYLGDPESTVFNNIQRKFTLGPTSEVKYLTSALPLGHVAVWLNKLLSKDGLFDLRMMGLVHTLFYIAGIATFLSAFRERRRCVRGAVAMACMVSLSDVRLVSYFNSFFSEGAQLVFLILTVGLSLHLCRSTVLCGVRYIVLYLAWAVSAVLFCIAKTQDLIFCIPFAILAYRFLPKGRFPLIVRFVAGAGFLALFCWAVLSDAYLDTRAMNLHVVLNEEILVHSPNPQRDIEELSLLGTKASGFVPIVRFYLNHLDRFFALIGRRMEMAFDYIPYGSFEKPMTGVSTALDGWSEWKRTRYPRSVYFWSATLLGYLGVLTYKFRCVDNSTRMRNRSLLNALLAMSCVAEFLVVCTFEANGPKKHFFIFNVLVDVVTILATVDLATIFEGWWSRFAIVTQRAQSTDSPKA